MSVYVNGNISKVYVGTDSISKIYVGNQLVFAKEAEVDRYFYFQIADSSNTAKVGFERHSVSFVASGATNPPTINYSNFTNYTAPTFEYSYNGVNWNSYTLGSNITIGGSNSNIVYFRGDNTASWYDTYTTTTTETVDGEEKTYDHEFRVWTQAIISDNNVKCGGNIMSLRYKSFSGKVTLPCVNAFRALFYDRMFLVGAPVLPATTITNYCYAHMFYGTYIKTTPKLPATTLKEGCYASMFGDCTVLTTVSTISATSLAKNCYGYTDLPSSQYTKNSYGMFGHCSKLTTPPTLPITTLAEGCYQYMFASSGITSAPTLSAGTMQPYCYYSMFYNCSKLTAPPTLSSTSLANYCYARMFYGSNITSAPALPATTMKESCYSYMFYSCSNLTTPPTLSGTTLANNCYEFMFAYSGITSAPTLSVRSLMPYCYYYMFYYCQSLTVPPALPATSLSTDCYYSMFAGCTALTKISKLPATTMEDYCYSYMYDNSNVRASATSVSGCSNVFRIPTSGTGTASSKGFSNMFDSFSDPETAFNPSLNTNFYINVPSF